jgi:hypothetical protein
VTFRLLIDQTPIPGAPLLVNTQLKTTDDGGYITASVNSGQYYTVTTGLDAISFAPLFDRGETFITNGNTNINATRLVSATGDACRATVGGVGNIYFKATNTTDRTLSIPLTYTRLNAIYSVTGQAAPPTLFAPGLSSFAIPESHFKQATALSGVWTFLGQNIVVNSDIRMCTDNATPGQCQPLPASQLQSPFAYTRVVVMKLTRLALDAARSGQWRTVNGSFTVPFLTRGSSALATMQSILKNASRNSYVCSSTPKGCRTINIDKRGLRMAFSRIFEGNVPRGLEGIKSLGPQEKKLFEAELAKLPDQYVTCSNPLTK